MNFLRIILQNTQTTQTKKFRLTNMQLSSSLFRQKKLKYPTLSPIMTNLKLKIL